MALVAFVVNLTLLRDPQRFLLRCRTAATDRGWAPWFGPAGGMQDSLALARRAVAAGASLVFAADGAEPLPRRARSDRALECLQARRVQVSADAVLPRQIDGEIVAPGRALSVSVCPGTLTVRLPE